MQPGLQQSNLYPQMYCNIDGTIVYNAKLDKYYTPYVNNSGYLYAAGIPVHRIVASAFLFDTYFEGATVDHVDRNKMNNHASNLNWVTQAENAKRSYAMGRKGTWLGRGADMSYESRRKQAIAITGAKNPAAKTRTIRTADGRTYACHTRMELADCIERLYGKCYSLSYIKCLIRAGYDPRLGFKIIEGQSTIETASNDVNGVE